MAEIQEISTSVVGAANNNSSTKIHLTPWDLQLLLVDSIQKGLLFNKSKPDQENAQYFLDHLKASLSRTLDFFPPLAGRLSKIKHEDNTQSFFIDCNNAGAEFTHKIASGLSVIDILEPKYVPRIVHSFFPLNGVCNFEGISKPLLAVQVTELEDGYFVGCTVNHCVADGTSFWNFFNSWAEISRGFDFPSKFPTTLNRWFPECVNSPVHIPSIDEREFDAFIPPPLEERVFHFSKENIAKLKEIANSDVNSNEMKTEISSLQAVLAHIWRSVIRCRITNADASKTISLKLIVGARQRLVPPMPEGYFGNAVHFVSVTTTAGQLLSHGLGWTARQLNEAVAAQTHETTKNFYENWLKCPHIVGLGALTNNSLCISSSPRFDVYGNDFGWGKPVAVRSGAANKYDGKITVFSGLEQGSMDIEICLLNSTLQAMEKDVEFMEFVSM